MFLPRIRSAGSFWTCVVYTSNIPPSFGGILFNRLVFSLMTASGHSLPRHPVPAPNNVRCYSNSGHSRVCLECPLCANSGLMQCSNQPPYSITSSARSSSVGGIVRPIAFAVLRLITSSNVVGCSIGRSLGFAPAMIFLT
jgi:hypothetical protein